MEYVRSLSERLLLEREETIAKLSLAFDRDREVRLALQQELQKEMQRLRNELMKSRKAETMREKELAFLQAQFIEAVDRISELEGKQREIP